jgi:uncharacterized FAD-dependent dehydrogenase
VFVGAGPANLVAANVLLERGSTSLLILEEGSSFNKRGCPGLRHSLCTHCNGSLCHVIGGEGGSSARFGNKLCYFPASERILEHFAEDVVSASSVYLDELLKPFFQSPLNHRECSSFANGTPEARTRTSNRKHYVSEILLKSDFEQLIYRLLSTPREKGLIRSNTAVKQIVKTGDSAFGLHTANGETINAQRVILGCGRSSQSLLRGWFASLGVAWEQPSQDVGIRLEAPAALFTEDFSYQLDPKYKFAHSSYGTSRTFCGCHGGIIVPVKVGESFYADGAFGDEFTNSSNIAFMVRSRDPLASDLLEEWCIRLNSSARGSLLLGKVPMSVTEPRTLVSEIMALVPAWPTVAHQIMMCELLTLTLGGDTMLLHLRKHNSADLRVLGPAIDRYWPKPQLKKGLETNVPGLFVLGDITGISRGFVQAMVSGAAWAMTQVADHRHLAAVHSTGKEVNPWFVSA